MLGKSVPVRQQIAFGHSPSQCCLAHPKACYSEVRGLFFPSQGQSG